MTNSSNFHNGFDERRLDKLDAKIDDAATLLRNALIEISSLKTMNENLNQQLKRIEDNAITQQNKHDLEIERLINNHSEGVKKLSDKIDDLDKRTSENTRITGIISKLFWIAVVAFAGSSVTKIFMS